MLWDAFLTTALASPFRGLFPHELARALGGAEGTRPTPPMDVHQSGEGLLLTFAVPGVAPEDLEVTFERGALRVRGRVRPDDTGNARARRLERSTGPFERTVRVPFEVDPESIEARHAEGMLRVRLSRAASDRPVRVPITSH